MKRIAFFSAFLLTATMAPSIAHAEMIFESQGITQETTYIEDFEDVDGEPAFDSNFEYQFLTTGTPPRETNWFLCDDDYFFSTPERRPFLFFSFLFFSGLVSVEFDLPEDSFVYSVSLDLVNAASSASVTFTGADDEKVFAWPSWPSFSDFQTVSATADEIGSISSVRIFCFEGYIDNIVVQATVVPEPTVFSSIFVVFMAVVFMKVRRSASYAE